MVSFNQAQKSNMFFNFVENIELCKARLRYLTARFTALEFDGDIGI